MTRGRGPDRCIDAVGAEAHSATLDTMMDKTRQILSMGSDSAHVLREAIKCCRKGGTISIPGVYIGAVNNIPFGAAMNKGLTFKMGQTHVQKYSQLLLEKILDDEINPALIITHRIKLDDASHAYKDFYEKNDACIKVVMTP